MKVLLASILLEPCRWKPGRPASLRVGDWSTRAVAAGFDGWELFENHYKEDSVEGQRRLVNGPLPVDIYNTYEAIDSPERPALGDVIAHVAELRASALKFNLGTDRSAWPHERTGVAAVATRLHPARLLCECHPGTSVEDPGALLEFAEAWHEWPFDVILHPFLLAPEAVHRWGRLLGKRIRHVHVQLRDRRHPRRFLALEEDAPRVNEVLAALAGTGFAGGFSLEFSATTGRDDETPENAFAAAVRDLAFLREHWMDPSP